jgi:hypothetical protein
LEELLLDADIQTQHIVGKITSVKTDGEVSVNTRKGKTILFYELNVLLGWEGSCHYNAYLLTVATLLQEGHHAQGTIEMPYISDENDDDDFEIKLTVQGGSRSDDNVKDSILNVTYKVCADCTRSERLYNTLFEEQNTDDVRSATRRFVVGFLLLTISIAALGQTGLQLKRSSTKKLDSYSELPTTTTPPTTPPATPPTPAKSADKKPSEQPRQSQTQATKPKQQASSKAQPAKRQPKPANKMSQKTPETEESWGWQVAGIVGALTLAVAVNWYSKTRR